MRRWNEEGKIVYTVLKSGGDAWDWAPTASPCIVRAAWRLCRSRDHELCWPPFNALCYSRPFTGTRLYRTMFYGGSISAMVCLEVGQTEGNSRPFVCIVVVAAEAIFGPRVIIILRSLKLEFQWIHEGEMLIYGMNPTSCLNAPLKQ